jgi:hypothetical protein
LRVAATCKRTIETEFTHTLNQFAPGDRGQSWHDWT